MRAAPIDLGVKTSAYEVQGPRAYQVTRRHPRLHGLEDGEIRDWPETCLFIIDERTGQVMIEGGYGTFSYMWHARGRGEKESLHAFLYDLGFDYFMGKAAKEPVRIYDPERTQREMVKELLRDRWERNLDRDEARDLYETLAHACAAHGHVDAERQFVSYLYEDTAWSRRLDCSDPTWTRENPRLRTFWDEFWRPFCQQILRPHWLDYVKQWPLHRSRALVIVHPIRSAAT